MTRAEKLRREALIEKAFREAHQLGYSQGLTDGHPLGYGAAHDEDQDWVDFKEEHDLGKD